MVLLVYLVYMHGKTIDNSLIAETTHPCNRPLNMEGKEGVIYIFVFCLNAKRYKFLSRISAR